MLNALSDMVEVWAVLGGGEGVRGCGDVPAGGTDSAIRSTIIRNVSKTRTSQMYPLLASCTQEAGTLAVRRSGEHHRLGNFAEVVGRNRVRWSAARLSNSQCCRARLTSNIKNLYLPDISLILIIFKLNLCN